MVSFNLPSIRRGPLATSPSVLTLLTAGVFGCLAMINTLHAQTAPAEGVVVSAESVPSPTPYDDRKAKLDHIMSEASGTEITVTKKATVIKLDQQPIVVN